MCVILCLQHLCLSIQVALRDLVQEARRWAIELSSKHWLGTHNNLLQFFCRCRMDWCHKMEGNQRASHIVVYLVPTNLLRYYVLGPLWFPVRDIQVCHIRYSFCPWFSWQTRNPLSLNDHLQQLADFLASDLDKRPNAHEYTKELVLSLQYKTEQHHSETGSPSSTAWISLHPIWTQILNISLTYPRTFLWDLRQTDV